MKAKIVFPVISTALAVALASAPAAHPADAKVYHGSACQPYMGNQTASLNYYDTYLLNADAKSQTVTCPIVRDNIGNTNGVIGADVRVQGNPPAALTCTLHSFSAIGDLLETDVVSTTSQNVNVLPLDIDISTQGGTYSLLCALPPLGKIYGYSVNEY